MCEQWLTFCALSDLQERRLQMKRLLTSNRLRFLWSIVSATMLSEKKKVDLASGGYYDENTFDLHRMSICDRRLTLDSLQTIWSWNAAMKHHLVYLLSATTQVALLIELFFPLSGIWTLYHSHSTQLRATTRKRRKKAVWMNTDKTIIVRLYQFMLPTSLGIQNISCIWAK